MSNIFLAHTNRADSCTLSNGSWVSTSTIARDNLKDGDIDKVARTSNALAASTRFAADLGANYSIRAIALVSHNLTAATATWQVKGGTVAPDASNVFASGQVFDSGVLNAKQLTFYGDTPSDWGAQYNVIYVRDAATVRYITVDITDTGNAAGYVQIGRLFIGGGFQPADNVEYGLQDGHEELSTFTRSKAGKRFYTRQTPRPRWVQFALPQLSVAEGDQVHEMDAALGITEEVLYVPDPADMVKTQRYGFLGNMRELSPLEYPFYNNRSKAYRIDQKL